MSLWEINEVQEWESGRLFFAIYYMLFKFIVVVFVLKELETKMLILGGRNMYRDCIFLHLCTSKIPHKNIKKFEEK